MKNILDQLQTLRNIRLGAPVDTKNIILCQKELIKNQIAQVPDSFLQILHRYNAISYDCANIYGIAPQGKIFFDSVKTNILSPMEDKKNTVILGADEFDYMAYNTPRGLYQIIDKEDMEVLEEYTDIEQALYHILKI